MSFELRMERLIDAPPVIVFDTYVDPDAQQEIWDDMLPGWRLIESEIAGAKGSPYWPGLEGLAHTLAHDAALYGPPPIARLATITQPTLVATGGGADLFEEAADTIAASMAHGERLRRPGARRRSEGARSGSRTVLQQSDVTAGPVDLRFVRRWTEPR